MQKLVAYSVFVLVLAGSAVYAQDPLSSNGCTKNCIICARVSEFSSIGPDQRSCQKCVNSSPKATSVLTIRDCSGPAITNCEVHSLEVGTGRVLCDECKAGFVKKITGDPKVDSCVTMELTFEGCAYGVGSGCAFCKPGLESVRDRISDDPGPKCFVFSDPKKAIANCSSHVRVGTTMYCNRCNEGYQLSLVTDGCRKIPTLPNKPHLCKSGYEQYKELVTCDACNWNDGYFATDAFFILGSGVYKQICTKEGETTSKFPWLLVLIILAVLIAVVVVIVIVKRKKSGNEGELKGSMISKN